MMICKSENLLMMIPLIDLREIGRMDIAVDAGITGDLQLDISLAADMSLVQWNVCHICGFLFSGGETGSGITKRTDRDAAEKLS